jgi:hypothetical protein
MPVALMVSMIIAARPASDLSLAGSGILRATCRIS